MVIKKWGVKNFYLLLYSHVLPLILYLIITILMVALPTGIDISKQYFGLNENVLWSNYFWWFDYSTTHLFVNPLHNSYLFYPLGVDMVDCIFPLALFIPVTHVFNSVISYNLYVLSSFILAGYGMYLLANNLFKDKYIAFFSGLVFAFFPFHFGSALGHLHTFSIMWIPFFVLFFLKVFEDPTLYNSVISGIFFAINALTSWTIAVMLMVFILIFIIINLRIIFQKKYLIPFFVFSGVSLLLMSPGLFFIAKNYLHNPYMVTPFNSFVVFSADILAFIIPSPYHPLFGSLSNTIYSHFSGNYSENIMFIGYSVLILSVFGFIKNRNTIIFRIFAISFFVFFILSLGPYLHFNGIWEFTGLNLKIMLPGLITYYLPVFDMIRVPSRYDIMVMFCLAIIAGFGLQAIINKFNIKSTKKTIFIFLITLIILFEYSAVMPIQNVKSIPDFYSNISQEHQYSIVEIPIIRSNLDNPRGENTLVHYYEYQKVHNGKLLGGYFNRINPIYAKFALDDPVISILYSGNYDIISNGVNNPICYLQKEYNVRYIILHSSFIPDKKLEDLIQFLGNKYRLDNSVHQDPLIIYSTIDYCDEQSSHIDNYIQLRLSDGWFSNENWSGIPTRWIGNNASITLYGFENKSASLLFQVQSFHNPKTLEIFMDNSSVYTTSVSTNFVTVNLTIPLKKGENVIQLHVLEGCERPKDIPGLNNQDSRCVACAIQNVTLTYF